MPMSSAVLKETWDSCSLNSTVCPSSAFTLSKLESVPEMGDALAGSRMAR